MVWGEQDAFFPVAWAEELVGTFPDARLEAINSAGLFSLDEERPEAVARALLHVLVGAGWPNGSQGFLATTVVGEVL